jgi:hypothetical protein
MKPQTKRFLAFLIGALGIIVVTLLAIPRKSPNCTSSNQDYTSEAEDNWLRYHNCAFDYSFEHPHLTGTTISTHQENELNHVAFTRETDSSVQFDVRVFDAQQKSLNEWLTSFTQTPGVQEMSVSTDDRLSSPYMEQRLVTYTDKKLMVVATKNHNNIYLMQFPATASAEHMNAYASMVHNFIAR